jgi:Na+/melibiose symporter-like transporter
LLVAVLAGVLTGALGDQSGSPGFVHLGTSLVVIGGMFLFFRSRLPRATAERSDTSEADGDAGAQNSQSPQISRWLRTSMAFHAIFLVLLVVLSFVLITRNPSADTVAEILRGW